MGVQGFVNELVKSETWKGVILAGKEMWCWMLVTCTYPRGDWRNTLSLWKINFFQELSWKIITKISKRLITDTFPCQKQTNQRLFYAVRTNFNQCHTIAMVWGKSSSWIELKWELHRGDILKGTESTGQGWTEKRAQSSQARLCSRRACHLPNPQTHYSLTHLFHTSKVPTAHR